MQDSKHTVFDAIHKCSANIFVLGRAQSFISTCISMSVIESSPKLYVFLYYLSVCKNELNTNAHHTN